MQTTFEKEEQKIVVDLIVESMVPGTLYISLAAKGEVLHVVARYPVVVIGDRRSSVVQLADIDNSSMKTRLNGKNKVVDAHFMERRGFSVGYVPENGEVFQIQEPSNWSKGGETRHVPLEKIHPDNLQLFQRVSTCIYGIHVCAIDFITPDITRPWSEERGRVHEMDICVRRCWHVIIAL